MYVVDGEKVLCESLQLQLNSFWKKYDYSVIENSIQEAIGCMDKNMSSAGPHFKYVRDSNDEVCFSPYNTVEYCIFLYYLSNILYKKGVEKEAGLLYYLNKIMNQVELFYAIELPMHFWADHPIGSVLGRAEYGDCFFFTQGVTVGGNDVGVLECAYPSIGKNVVMCAGSSVLGTSKIGDNTIIGAGTIIKNQDIPEDSIVFGQSPNLIIKERKDKDQIKPLWNITDSMQGAFVRKETN